VSSTHYTLALADRQALGYTEPAQHTHTKC
jgi:hypothetical protein